MDWDRRILFNFAYQSCDWWWLLSMSFSGSSKEEFMEFLCCYSIKNVSHCSKRSIRTIQKSDVKFIMTLHQMAFVIYLWGGSFVKACQRICQLSSTKLKLQESSKLGCKSWKRMSDRGTSQSSSASSMKWEAWGLGNQSIGVSHWSERL